MVSITSGGGAGSANVNELLDQGAWSPFQKLILALMALAYLTDGIANQSLGLAIPALMQDWGLPREAFANVLALGLVGLTLGAVVGGVAGDRIGRRKMMIVSTGFFGLMTIAQAWAGNLTELMLLRFLDGVGIGAMIPNGAAVISEFTPRRERALALAVGMAFIAVGSTVAGMIGAAIIVPLGWEGLFMVLGGLAVVVALILALALPESPIFLANSGASQERLRAVAVRCGLPVGDQVLTANERDKTATKRLPLSRLFDGGVASSTIFLWISFFFCLLANYAMFGWLPVVLSALGFEMSVTPLSMTALSIGGIVGGVAGGWLIKLYGSRASVLTLAAGGVILAVVLGLAIDTVGHSLTTILIFLVLIGFFSAGLLNGLYTFSAFIYPDTARGTGVGAAAAAGRVGAIASSYAGVMALNITGPSGFFLFIGGSLLISLVMAALIRRQIPKAV